MASSFRVEDYFVSWLKLDKVEEVDTFRKFALLLSNKWSVNSNRWKINCSTYSMGIECVRLYDFNPPRIPPYPESRIPTPGTQGTGDWGYLSPKKINQMPKFRSYNDTRYIADQRSTSRYDDRAAAAAAAVTWQFWCYLHLLLHYRDNRGSGEKHWERK